MNKTPWIRLAGVLVLVSALAACDDALNGTDLDTDPNRASVADIEQLFHGVQIKSFFWHTGNVARAASMWTQQMAGTDRQYIDYDNYRFSQAEFNDEWYRIYTSGGLVDMRKVQALAAEQGDHVYAGIAKVYEALMMGMAASIWGDIPYSEAVGEVATPVFDDQADVYAQVQDVLDEAIADLAAGGGGPGSLDLAYGGDPTGWTRAAYTLKARFYMHWVEAQVAGAAGSSTACGGDCLERAITAARQGIASPAGNLVSTHDATPGMQNLWYQFISVFRPGYISAGEVLVDLLEARDDPRLETYFAPVGGAYVGAPPGTSGDYSQLNATTRGAAGFNQPLLTYTENQLILAEAYARDGQTAQAVTALNSARVANGLVAIAPPSAEVLQEIQIEKYIAMFQNIEVWNDMKRNCTPLLAPPGNNAALIARIFYSEDEQNANPNTPAIGSVLDRNDNDPEACPVP